MDIPNPPMNDAESNANDAAGCIEVSLYQKRFAQITGENATQYLGVSYSDITRRAPADAITLENVLDAISNVRRRHVIRALASLRDPDADAGGWCANDLARGIAAIEEGANPENVDRQAIRRVTTSLVQQHLPRLDAAGVLEWPGGVTAEITPGPAFDRTAAVMWSIDLAYLAPESVERAAEGVRR